MRLIDNGLKFGFVFIFAFFVACNSNDFETDSSGLRYKIVEKSESQEMIQPGDYAEMELMFLNNKDSILFNSKELRAPFTMQVRSSTHKGGSFENALMLMHPGDRMHFIIKADSFFYKTWRKELPVGVQKGSDIQFDLKIVRKLKPEEVFSSREEYLKEMKEQEDTLIKTYITENEIKATPTESGLYLIKKKEGNGVPAKSGSLITVHYIGKFTDGRVFDSSYQRNEPFEFELGAQQVIDAWEEACSQMKEGDKALLIAPSKLAYGNEGYGELIPPFTPLIFEIELISVQ